MPTLESNLRKGCLLLDMIRRKFSGYGVYKNSRQAKELIRLLGSSPDLVSISLNSRKAFYLG